jgi:hypothetical protein
MLLRALILALPSLLNVAVLLVVFMYMFAVVGVVAFGTTQAGAAVTDQVRDRERVREGV